MSSSLETDLPSIRYIQNLIRNSKEVEVLLVTGEKVAGKIRWQDPLCLCVGESTESSTLIWRQAIAAIKPRS